MEDARADIERLAGTIADARRAVVFTGAGISTESGIPDFRSPSGIWSQTTPIYYQEFLASEDARIEAWRRKFLVDRDIAGAAPNRGHRAVAKLVRTGNVSSVITQNIDNLHQDSGVRARSAGQGRRKIPLPRLRTGDRGLPALRRLPGKQARINGRFLGCSNWPACRYSRSIPKKMAGLMQAAGGRLVRGELP